MNLYEQKYKEILEWARKNKARLNGVPIEEVLPELAESEDERTRKWIVKFITEQYPECWKDKKNKMLAYLEKQKEQKPAEWSEEDEKKIIFLERLIEHNVPDGQYGWVDGMKGGFVTKSEAISMLKSFRPQKLDASKLDNFDPVDVLNRIKREWPMAWEKVVWKPSEEQMKALNDTINILAASPFLHQNDYLFSILNGLRKELKKLL